MNMERPKAEPNFQLPGPPKMVVEGEASAGPLLLSPCHQSPLRFELLRDCGSVDEVEIDFIACTNSACSMTWFDDGRVRSE